MITPHSRFFYIVDTLELKESLEKNGFPAHTEFYRHLGIALRAVLGVTVGLDYSYLPMNMFQEVRDYKKRPTLWVFQVGVNGVSDVHPGATSLARVCSLVLSGRSLMKVPSSGHGMAFMGWMSALLKGILTERDSKILLEDGRKGFLSPVSVEAMEKLQGKLTDEEKTMILDNDLCETVESDKPIRDFTLWELDKKDNGKIGRDGEFFFEVAKKIE